ncbi:hypothetical protein [Pengzhenrongella frigida]|uniref:Uncharacterized protein n=1 Tax=Pengzhenrongella frigida TaxID=1259133 RepID=A0A4Q5MY44_9MICO|nr:hypothetical protein [Cellulomonas sp. HLT2-17]RYV50692.1 hypothetical protein EUA98_12115 [Cellulomonas sp. HLT2-17]
MLWFTVWSVLVLATLGGGFLLGRDLWRKGKALLVEVGRAGDLASTFAVRTDELTAAGQQLAVTHDLFTVRAVPLARRAELRAARDRRRAVRQQRHDQTIAQWRGYCR